MGLMHGMIDTRTLLCIENLRSMDDAGGKVPMLVMIIVGLVVMSLDDEREGGWSSTN